MFDRHLLQHVQLRLGQQPAVVLLGPRQAGKATLARLVAACCPDAVFLDMENEADRARGLPGTRSIPGE